MSADKETIEYMIGRIEQCELDEHDAPLLVNMMRELLVLQSWQESIQTEAHTAGLLNDDYLVTVKDELESRGWAPDGKGEPGCVDKASAAGADAIHQFITLKIRAEHLAAKLVDAITELRLISEYSCDQMHERHCSGCASCDAREAISKLQPLPLGGSDNV